MADPEWLSEREQHAWRSFLAMQAQVRRRINAGMQRDSGLSEADYYVLVHLSEAPEGQLRIFELRKAAQWEKSRLTHQISRMAERGLVERLPCETDSRGAYVAITDHGRATIVEAAPLHLEHVRRWFIDLLSPRQLNTLAEIADSMLKQLDEADSE